MVEAASALDDLDAVLAAGVPVGVHADSGEEAAGFAAEGATILTVAVDVGVLGQATSQHLSVARGAGTDPD
jgi:4-hydroxy-2-oxoheptanedioate aldolase